MPGFLPPIARTLSRREAMCGLAAVATGLAFPAILRAAPPVTAVAPEELLKQHGLIRMGSGMWGLPLEAELKEKLAQLQPLKENIVTAEKDLEDGIAANRRAWQEAGPALETLRQAIAPLSPNDPKRVALTQKLGALEAIASEPARLGCRSEIRGKLIVLSRDRSLLALAALWIRANVPRLTDGYARLGQIAEVAAALRHGNERLGPLKNYGPEVKKLAEYEKFVFTDWLPIYQQAGQTRLAAIINEQAPVTFTWSEESQHTLLLPTSTLESCGLAVPGDAVRRQVKLEERNLSVAEIKISALRLGRHVVKNLTAYVLPPEGEDIGARLPRTALKDLRVNIEADRLRLTLSE